jgi:ABC-type transport system involved in cytochrome c biogenesis permease subunit
LTLVAVFFLVGLIDNALFSFLYSIPVCSEGNIVDHISAKYKLAWCCLHCCMIGASNSLVTMQLIEGSNQMNYILLVLDIDVYSSSQMILACH